MGPFRLKFLVVPYAIEHKSDVLLLKIVDGYDTGADQSQGQRIG
jgi:hypothetical protein